MSVKVMGVVWDLDLKPNLKYVLLAYADHADHDGSNIWPAIETIALKTGYSERQVRYNTRELEAGEFLVRDGTGPGGTNRYRIPIADLVLRPIYRGGANIAPGGAISAPGGGQFLPDSVSQIAPDPSFNPSLEPSIVVETAPTLNGPQIPLPAYLATEPMMDAWLRWQIYHEERGKPLTRSTAIKQFQDFNKWGPEMAIEAIDYSIKQGYAGLYQPKKPAKAKGQPKAGQSEYRAQVI